MSSLRFATQRTTVVNITGEQIAHMTETPILLIPAPGEGKFILPRHMLTEAFFGDITYYALFTTGNGSVAFYANGEAPSANFNTSTIGGALGVLLSGVFESGGHSFAMVESDFGIFTVKTIQSFVTDVEACTNSALMLTYIWSSAEVPGPIPLGPVASSTLGEGGSGYVVGDTGYLVDQSSLHDTLYEITAVGEGGAVTAYTITAPGTKAYGPGIAGQMATTSLTGDGVDLTIVITSLAENDTQMRVTIDYDLIEPLGAS